MKGWYSRWSMNLSFPKEVSPILVVDRTRLVHCASLLHIVKPESLSEENQLIKILLLLLIRYFQDPFDTFFFSDFGKPCVLFYRVKLPFWESVSRVSSNLGDHLLGLLLHCLVPEQSKIWVVSTFPAWYTEIPDWGSGPYAQIRIMNRTHITEP